MEWLFTLLKTLTDGDVDPRWLVLLVVAMLLASGMGVPLPEDIPLVYAGYLCHAEPDLVRVEWMIPLTLIAVVGADSFIYLMGRRYGHHVPRIPILGRHLSQERLQRAQLQFHRHGGKTLFVARFLPGLRAPAFFSAGVFKIPYWKFLLYDGGAALISVPVLVGLAYYFGDGIDAVLHSARRTEHVVAGVALAAVVLFIVWQVRRHKKAKAAKGVVGSGANEAAPGAASGTPALPPGEATRPADSPPSIRVTPPRTNLE